MAKVTITIEDNPDKTTESVLFVESNTDWTPDHGESKAIVMAAAILSLIDEVSKEPLAVGGTD